MVVVPAERRVPLAAPDPEPTAANSRTRLMGMLLLGATGCVLLLLSLDRVLRALALIPRQVEAMYGESIIYDQAARLLRGEALYQSLNQPPFTVTAYTPAYYWLVAGLRIVAGPGFGPGRALSFAAGLATAAVVGYLATRRTVDWRAGIVAVALFLGLGFPGDYPWFAFYKEDMLGAALSLGAIAALERRGDHTRSSVGAGLLAGAAFLVKQTFVAASLVGFVWLWRSNRRSASTFAATVLAVAIVPCALLQVSNQAFFDNVVRANLNPYSPDILLSNLAILARYQAVPVALALLGVASRAVRFRDWADDPLVAFWMVSFLLLPLTLGKVGSNWNYWIPFAAATAPLATQSLWAVLVRRGTVSTLGRLSVVAALLGLLVSPAWLPRPELDLRSVLTHTMQPDQRQANEFADVLQRVRSEPGEVLAEPLDILVLADRQIAFEPYIFSILSRQGQWDPGRLVRQICSGQIGLLVLDHRLDGPDWQYQGYTHWPAIVLDALRGTMRLDRTQARLYLYVPSSNTAGREATISRSESCGNGT